jgi:hypothetical protein
LGLKIALADIEEDKLKETGKEISAIVGNANVLIIPTDVSKIDDVVKLRDKVYETWGEVRLRTQRAHYPVAFPTSLLTFNTNRHYPFYHGPAVTLFVKL